MNNESARARTVPHSEMNGDTNAHTQQRDQLSVRDSIESDIAYYIELGKSVSLWATAVSQLAAAELKQSIKASANVAVYGLLIPPVALVFYASICFSVYIAIAHATSNPYWGLAGLLGVQVLVLAAVVTAIKRYKTLIGLTKTKLHIQEAFDAVTKKDE